MKKIFRVPEEKMIAGICAGVADMFSVDVTLVRLGFVFLCVFTGVAPLIVTYLIGWFIIPEKSSLQETRNNSDNVA